MFPQKSVKIQTHKIFLKTHLRSFTRHRSQQLIFSHQFSTQRVIEHSQKFVVSWHITRLPCSFLFYVIKSIAARPMFNEFYSETIKRANNKCKNLLKWWASRSQQKKKKNTIKFLSWLRRGFNSKDVSICFLKEALMFYKHMRDFILLHSTPERMAKSGNIFFYFFF